ncbi:MAG: hypothetical protein ACFB9N_04045 [Geitlerinemataceae cyanobacterium]
MLRPLFSIASALSLLAPAAALLATPTQAQPDRCNYYLGDSVLGTPISIDTDSIVTVSQEGRDFVYCLGDEEIYSRVHCDDREWTTFPERARHSPQSRTTTSMVAIACSAPDRAPGIDVGVVHDPPANVFRSPDGDVLCTVGRFSAIATFGSTPDGWTRTDACNGTTGYVHIDDIRYDEPAP